MKLWKIYHGTHKVRKQEVCVFVFEKKQLESYPKNEHEELLMTLKCEAHSLVKYKHPSLLGVVEPFVENNNILGFVTERFDYTLNSWMTLVKPSKLEIKQMIIELSKVILFLHNDAHVIHGNLNPDVIFIDLNNRIKMSGLSFSINDPPLQGSDINLNSYIPPTMTTINPHNSPLSLPNLNFTAPELVFSSKLFYESDIFSLGLIIYQLLRDHLGEQKNHLLIKINSNTINTYKTFFASFESYITQKIKFEADDNNLLLRLLSKDHNARPKMREVLDMQWFNDPKLKALNFIMNLETNDQKKNIEFLEKFPRIVGMFENKIIIKRFLPSLLRAIKIEALINPCLPAIFSICESPNFKINFQNEIWPKLKDLFKLRSLPAAAIYFLISKVQFIGEHISSTEFSNNFLNLICKALDCNVQKIQFLVSNNMKFIAKNIDSLSFKNQIFPRLLQVVSTTNSKSLKIALLNNIKELYNKLDQSIINEKLLNSLEKIRAADNNNDICMCICDIYLEIAKIVNLENIATKILPNLIAMLVNGNITKANFDKILNLVNTYLERIKKSRYSDLSEDGGIGTVNMTATMTQPQTKTDDDNFMDSLLASSAPITATNTNNKGTGEFLNDFFGKSSFGGDMNKSSNTNNTFSFKTNTNTSSNNNMGIGGLNNMTNKNTSNSSMGNSGFTNMNIADLSNKNNNNSNVGGGSFGLDFLDNNQSSKKNNDLFAGVQTNVNYNTPVNKNNNNMMGTMNMGGFNNSSNNNNLFNNLNVNTSGNKNNDLLNNLMNDLPSSKNNNTNSFGNMNNNTFGNNNNNNFMTFGNNNNLGGMNNNTTSNNPFDMLMDSDNNMQQKNNAPTGVGNSINFDFSVGGKKSSSTNSNNNNSGFGGSFDFLGGNNMNNNASNNMNKNNNTNDFFASFGNQGNNNNNNSGGFNFY